MLISYFNITRYISIPVMSEEQEEYSSSSEENALEKPFQYQCQFYYTK